MRKFAVYGASALLVILSAVGISYAQDTATPAPSATEVAAPAAQAPTRVWLGVSVSDDGTGVIVKRVSVGSPAETAKLQVDDVILSVNGTAVDTAEELRAIIDAAASGDVVTLSVQRGTETLSVDVTLATISGRIGGRGGFGQGTPTLPTDSLQAAELVLHAQLTAVDGGYQVTEVNGNSSDTTLVVGDVITEVNGTAIASADWATLIVPPTDAPTAPTLTLTVLRDGTETTIDAQLFHFGGRGGFGGQPGNGGPGGRGGNNGGGNGGSNNNNAGQPPVPGNGNNNQPGGNGNNQPPAPPTGDNTQPSGGSV